MIVIEKPVIPPYVCIICGRQDREYFVDLGLQLDNHFQPLYDGAVLLCNECFDNTFTTGQRLIQEYLDGRGTVTTVHDSSVSGVSSEPATDNPDEPGDDPNTDSGTSDAGLPVSSFTFG